MPEGKAVIISAPSGAGKSTIVKYLLESGLNLEFSVSATTRQPRGEEKNGVDYYFLTVDEFKKKISNGEFVEWEEVYENHFYGTLRSELERIWVKNKHVLFDVDVKGGISLKKIFGDRALSLFIMPPSIEELEERLKKRGTDSPEKIKIRIQKAGIEMQSAVFFDRIVVNDDLEKAKQEAFSIINNFLNG
ncbi:MAG: guanylate kinase [Bacteroidales bacterium]